MKQVFFSVVLLLCFIIPCMGQSTPPELQRKLAGKKNLKAIMREVERFYKKEEEERERMIRRGRPVTEEEEEFENGLLHWKRWEYFNKTRLKPNGDLEDVAAKTIAAWEKVNEKYGVNNRTQSGSNAVWSFVGPSVMNYQGGLYRGLSKTDRIVFHPTDPNTFYVCSNNGGLWRTTNGGASWTCLTMYFPIQSVSGVVINPNNTANLYVITGDAKGGGGIAQNSCGIWVTNNGGVTWIKTNFNSDPQSRIFGGYKIMMMPNLTYILFAATQSGLYRSTDAGNNWTLVLPGQLLTDGTSPVYDIEFDPAQPARVYATSFGRFYLSEDFGSTFPASQQTNIPGARRMEIGVSPANFNYVYLLCGPYGGGVGTNTFKGIYRSTTGGTANSFVLRASSPNILCDATNGIVSAGDAGDQSGYDLAIDVHKTNAEIITVAGKIIWASTNGGTTLTNLTPYNEGGTVPPANYVHPDIQDIAYNPLNNNLYACTDGGVYVSSNGGATWASITNGIQASTFYHMAAAPFDVNRIMGGTQDNGVKYKSNAGDFTHITGADGFDAAFGPSAASSIYATVNSSVQKFDINGNGQPANTPANTSFFPVIAADPVTNNTVYLAAGAAGVLRSTDGAVTWTQVLNQVMQQSICTCPSNSTRLYVASTNSIFRTDNSGTNWSTDLSLNPGFINSGQITDINVCSGNSSIVYVTMGGYTAGQKVFYSTNAGASWLNISGTLPAEVKVNCVAIDQGNNAYIGTDMGVYYQAATSSDWTPFYNELPRVPVTDLVINQGSSRIRASTYGQGIWETELFTVCDANFILSGIIEGEQFVQASNQITAVGTVTGGSATKVIARAGNEIVLIPGFTIYESNTFRAYLGPCESGPVPTARTRAADIPPLIMSQADKGDNTTLYRYGAIRIEQTTRQRAAVVINAIQPGDFSLIVTGTDDTKQLIRLDENITAAGTITKSIDTGDLEKGIYYVQLYRNGRLVHIQELIIP